MSKTLCSPTRLSSGGVKYFKAVRPDGTDFHSGTVRWVPEQGEIPAEGIIVTHPTSSVWGLSHATHLCASSAPTDCTGFKWPCRLLEVEPVGEVYHHKRSKWSALSWRVVRELPAVAALGPQSAAVVVLVDGLRRSVRRPFDAWDVAWDAAEEAARAAWDAARAAAFSAARLAAGVASGDAAWCAARLAAGALVVWDLLTPDQHDILTAPIRTALPGLWAEVSSHLPH